MTSLEGGVSIILYSKRMDADVYNGMLCGVRETQARSGDREQSRLIVNGVFSS